MVCPEGSVAVGVGVGVEVGVGVGVVTVPVGVGVGVEVGVAVAVGTVDVGVGVGEPTLICALWMLAAISVPGDQLMQQGLCPHFAAYEVVIYYSDMAS